MRIFIVSLLINFCWLFSRNIQAQPSGDWMQLSLQDSQGKPFALSSLQQHKLTVLLFIDRECPISQKYGATIRQLYQKFQQEKVEMIAVYPLTDMTPALAEKFARTYQYTFPQLIDNKQALTAALGAEVTPEAFLVDAQGKVIYHGAIDNWFYALGRYRKVITENYLEDAITAYLKHEPLAVPETRAIGCFIGQGKMGEIKKMQEIHKNH